MKVAVALCLFACVAVSHAAFSGSLVKQAKPVLDQTLFKIRLASTSRSVEGAEFQSALLEGIQAHITGLLGQIEGGVSIIQGIQGHLQQALQDIISQIQPIVGGIVGQVGPIVEGFLQQIQSIFGSLFGRAMSQKGIWDIITGGLNLQQIIAGVQALLAQHIGGMGLHEVVLSVLSSLGINLPESVVQFIMGLFPGNNEKGLWDTVTGWWGQLTGAAAQALAALTQQMQQITQTIMTHGQAGLAQVQQMAQSFVTAGTAHVGALTAQAAQQMLEFLAPYQQDLGALWQQVLDTVGSIGSQ